MQIRKVAPALYSCNMIIQFSLGMSIFCHPEEISLARFLIKQRRFEEAGDALEYALETQIEAYGPYHHFVAMTLVEKAALMKVKL